MLNSNKTAHGYLMIAYRKGKASMCNFSRRVDGRIWIPTSSNFMKIEEVFIGNKVI
jgi:hypothetical protein